MQNDKNNPVKTTTNTHYEIGIAGQAATFTKDGYSKYNKRWSDKSIMPWDVYGYSQALEHIEELRAHEYNGKLIHADATFEVRIKTTITTCINIEP